MSFLSLGIGDHRRGRRRRSSRTWHTSDETDDLLADVAINGYALVKTPTGEQECWVDGEDNLASAEAYLDYEGYECEIRMMGQPYVVVDNSPPPRFRNRLPENWKKDAHRKKTIRASTDVLVRRD